MEKAQAGYMELVFNRLLELSVPVDKNTPFPRKWFGALSKLIAEVTIANGKRGNYQKISTGLYELGAVVQTYRGGGSTTSEYLITRPQLWINEDGTPATPKGDHYRNRPDKQVEQALAALNRRVQMLETQMAAVLAAAAYDASSTTPKTENDEKRYTTKDLLQ